MNKKLHEGDVFQRKMTKMFRDDDIHFSEELRKMFCHKTAEACHKQTKNTGTVYLKHQ